MTTKKRKIAAVRDDDFDDDDGISKGKAKIVIKEEPNSHSENYHHFTEEEILDIRRDLLSWYDKVYSQIECTAYILILSKGSKDHALEKTLASFFGE